MGKNNIDPTLGPEAVEKLHPKMQRFLKELENIFGKEGFHLTSGADYKDKRKNQKSKHKVKKDAEGNELPATAIDLRARIPGNPDSQIDYEKIHDFFTKTKEGIALLKKYGYGFKYEPSKKSSSGDWSAPHFHIADDDFARSSTEQDWKAIQENPDTALDADYILRQKDINYRTVKKKKYEEEKAAIKNDETLLDDERKQQLDRLESKYAVRGDYKAIKSEEDIQKKFIELKDRYDKIVEMEDEEQQNAEYAELEREVSRYGLVDNFNGYIDLKNGARQKEVAKYMNLKAALKDADLRLDKEGNLKSIKLVESEALAQAQKDFPELFSGMTTLKDGKLFTSLKGADDFMTSITKMGANLGDPSIPKAAIQSKFGKHSNEGTWKQYVNPMITTEGWTGFKDDKGNSAGFLGHRIYANALGDFINWVLPEDIQKDLNTANNYYGSFDTKLEQFMTTALPQMEEDETWKKEGEEEIKKEREQESQEGSGTGDTTGKDQTKKESFDAKKYLEEEQLFTDGFFNEKDTLDMKDVFNYDAGDYPIQLPVEALGYAALAMKGMGDAEEEIPRYDHQISQAILKFTQDTKRLSELGLSPEEEAAMKKDAADMYADHVNQIVRASGGDRNKVLGNLTGANLGRINQMANVALADLQVKQANRDKYGQLLQYINEFDTSRKIANRDIDIEEARRKREQGETLANTSWAAMLNEIQYQKENGPGSANHMLKAALVHRITGIVPGKHDNGLGDTPGTKSYQERLLREAERYNANVKQENAIRSQIRDEWKSMKPQVRSEINQDIGFETWFNQRKKAILGGETQAPTIDEVQGKPQTEATNVGIDGTAITQSLNEPVTSEPRITVSGNESYLHDGDTVYVEGEGQRLHMFDAEEKGYGKSNQITQELGQYPISYPEQEVNTDQYGRKVRSDVRIYPDANQRGHALDSSYMAKGGRGRWDLRYAKTAQDSARATRLNEQFKDQIMSVEELRLQKAQNRQKYGNR